jgi:hypothetical protein
MQGKAELVVQEQRIGCSVRFHGLNYSAQFNCVQFVILDRIDSWTAWLFNKPQRGRAKTWVQ